MLDKKEIQEIIEKAENQKRELEILIKSLENVKVEDFGRVKNNEIYWFVNNGKLIDSDTESGHPIDNERYDCGNYYLIKEDAIKYINREHNGRPRFENYPNKLNGLAGTVTANLHKGVPYGIITGDDAGFKPRRLTPLEAWRLMGFSDDNFSKAESAGVSVSQLYMQAGNTVVIPVLEYIFNNLFRGNYNKESE